MTVLAVAPNLPGFGRGLTYTAFFYTAWGSAIRLVATAFLAGLALILAAMTLEASIWPVAVWIDDGELRWRALGQRKLKLSSISDVSLDERARMIRVLRADGKGTITWSTVALRARDAPGPLLTRLRAAIR